MQEREELSIPLSFLPQMCKPGLALAVRLSYASLGVVIGVSVCPVFSVVFYNPAAAYWGTVSAFFAAFTLLLFLYLFLFIRPFSPPLPAVLLVSGVVSSLGVAAGVGGFATYLWLGILNTLRGDDRPLFETEYIVCVWAFMTFKWSITSYYYSIKTYNIHPYSIN